MWSRWGRTIAINAALCDKLGAGAFPTPAQLLSAGASGLQACGLGYRAKTLLRLAEQVCIVIQDTLICKHNTALERQCTRSSS